MTYPTIPTYLINELRPTKHKKMYVTLGILIFIVIFFTLAVRITSPITDAAQQQLSAIKAGNIQNAYNLTTMHYQAQTPLPTYEKYISQYPILKKYKNVSFGKPSVENDMAYLSGILQAEDGSTMHIEYQLVKENHAWKILAFRLSK